MPTTTVWISPDVFLFHNGVTVYHTYRDDDYEQGAMTHWFTLDKYSDENHFDERDFPQGASVRETLRLAIDAGTLKLPED